jgi:predicted LPLAT superfamily acyltransferase
MPDNHTWEGRSRGTKLGYKFFVGLLRFGGLRAAYSLLHFVTAYYRLFMKSATTPLKQFYSRLGYRTIETNKLVKRNLLIFGQTLIDKIAVLSGIKHSLSFTHEGIENIEQLVKDGKGGILVSAHLGNWEVAGHLLSRVKATINIVMYDGEEENMKAYMEQFENKRSFNLILIKDDLSHIYEISAALNRNELICLHADRFRPGNRIIEHDFLGEKAKFPAGPFILASKLKAPVCFVFAFKETNFQYHFYAFPGKVYEGRGTEGMQLMLDDYVLLLEKMLKKYPEQWFNYFDFWKQ